MEKPTDFAAILQQLSAWGVNDYQLAELTGISRSYLTNLRLGRRKEPGYDNGTKIMRIYKRELRKHPKLQDSETSKK